MMFTRRLGDGIRSSWTVRTKAKNGTWNRLGRSLGFISQTTPSRRVRARHLLGSSYVTPPIHHVSTSLPPPPCPLPTARLTRWRSTDPGLSIGGPSRTSFHYRSQFCTGLCPRSRDHSTETLRTRRSHRSRSRERERDKDKDRRHKDRDNFDDRRKRSRSRDKRDRSRDRSHRDREHDRERERERDRERRRDRDGERRRSERDRPQDRRSHRDRERNRDRERDRERDRDDRDHRDRRRKRADDQDDGHDGHSADERVKRKRTDEGGEESSLPAPPPSAGLPAPPPPMADSPRRRNRSREPDRRYGDRPRRSRDPRDDFDDPRYRRDRERSRPPSPPQR